MLFSSSGSNNKPRKTPARSRQQTEISCLTYFLTLMMDATCSSETSIDFWLTVRLYMPENKTLWNQFNFTIKSLKNASCFVLSTVYNMWVLVSPLKHNKNKYQITHSHSTVHICTLYNQINSNMHSGIWVSYLMFVFVGLTGKTKTHIYTYISN
jgi:hypothetical protein